MSSILIWFAVSFFVVLIGSGVRSYYRYANRGFDITDEAIFYLQAQRPQDVHCYPFFDFAYLAPVFRWCNENLVFMRKLIVPLLGASEIIFAFGCYSALCFLNPAFQSFSVLAVFICCACSCSFSRFCFGPRVPFYNNLSSFLLLTSCGLVLSALYGQTWTYSSVLALMFFAGCFSGFQLFIKVSCALAVSIGEILLVSLSIHWSIAERFECTALYLVGVAAAVLMHCLFIFSPKATWETFNNQVKIGKAFGWGTACIPRHYRELSHYFREILVRDFFVWALVLNAAWVCSLISIVEPQIIQLFLFFTGLLLTKVFERAFGDGVLRSKHYQIETSTHFLLARLVFFGAIAGISLLTLIPAAQFPQMRTLLTAVVLFGFLAGLPLAACVGTGNQIYHNLVFQLSPWGLAVSGVLLFFGYAAGFLPVSLAVIVLFGWITQKNYLHGMIRDPYRVNGTLDEQTVPVKIGKSSEILVDPRTAQFFNDVRAAFEENGFKKGDNIIGLFDLPGLVFLVDGVSPGHQWFYGFTEIDIAEIMQQANFEHLMRVPEESRKKSFLVTNGNVSVFNKHFEALNMKFPSDYVACKSTPHHLSGTTITVWKPLASVQATDRVSSMLPVVEAAALLKRGEPELAQSVLKELEIIDMPDATPYVLLGQEFASKGFSTEAIECLGAVIKRFPNHFEAGLALTTIMIKLDRLDVAEQLVQTALGPHLRNGRVLNLLAAIYEMKGKFEDAKLVRQSVVEQQL